MPVGSSASKQAGWVTNARAIATRWRSPPESSPGLWANRSRSPTRTRSASASLAARRGWVPRMSNGMATFSTAVNSANRWWN
ncbi:hypothetical protein NB231_17013 [Nitrococcus mobilis Nb-231]|uniref:Uncharacterized protein n=1 Tax=Nitrococcus mobilis Nb-231 TaxID=314278 RepID=A4BMK3_9GAMM|nr:hypothetical protein NB231_17013 [Nitrococcus mobilis Nb-231]